MRMKVIAVAIVFSALSLDAGEIIGTSLKWSLSRYAKIEGNILTVNVPPDCAMEGGNAIATVDLSAIDGQCFSASVRCRGENVSRPAEHWNGLKFQFEFSNLTTGEMMYPNTKSRLGTFPEETIQTTVADAGGRLEKVKLTLGLQRSSGKVVFDLSTLKIRSGCDIYPRVNGDYRVRYPERVKRLPQLKGVMLPAGPCKEEDFRTLKEWGATLARYQMVRNWNAKNANRELDDYMLWLDGKLDHLDREVLPWAEKYGVRIVVDMHVPPGGSNGGDMNMFYEQKYNDAFVNCWRKIARRFKGRKAIYGYDLINEPQQTDKAVCDYWNTQRRAAEAVREIDPDVTIVMESNGWDSPGTYSYLSPLKLDNVIYQVHMYEPFVFTHQGIHPGAGNAAYPDEAKGWNRAYLEKRLAPVREFQRKHNVRIYVGEFSAAAWAPGAARYLADCISLFNEYGWDWTYHAFREWPGWSVEHEGTGPSDMKPSADTSRKRVLLRGLSSEPKSGEAGARTATTAETWQDPAWIRVAASDSRAEAQTAADFVCTGTNDELTIQKAVDDCKANGKQLFFFSGLYVFDSVRDFGDGGPEAAVCFRNMHREFAVVGERRQLTGMDKDMAANGVVFYLQPKALEGAGGKSVDILRGEWSVQGIMNGSGLRLENVAVYAPDSQCSLRALDLQRVNSAELRNVQLNAFGTATLKKGLQYPYGNPPPPHHENIGITLTDGSNNAPVHLQYVVAIGFGQGFQVGGEHVVMINCAAAFGGYGFTFGNYPYSCAFNHPITLINCCDEQNIHLPLFNSCGDKGGQLHGRQEVTMVSFNCERVAAHAPGGRLGDLMREVRPGTWRGNISFTRQPNWNAINSVDQPIWAEDGSGSGFVTRNNAHKPACGTVERLSYYPQYMQQVYDTDLNKLLICTDPAKRVWRDAMGNIIGSKK